MTKSLGIVDVNVQLGPVAGGARGARAKGEHPSTPRDSQVSAERTD